MSAVQLADGSTSASDRDAAEAAKDETTAAASVASSVARISNTAIVSSIAFPAIFEISITFEMPFGFPPVLVQFAEWVTSIVSLDLGQVGSPECGLSDAPEKALLWKFFATVRTLDCTLSLSRSIDSKLKSDASAARGLPGALRAPHRA